MGSLELVQAPPVQSLDDLAETVRREHEETQTAVASALEHAIAAGTALLAVRERMRGTAWTHWCRKNLPGINQPAITTYVRLARYREIVWADSEVQTIQQATQLLHGMPPANTRNGGEPVSPEVKAKAKELVAEGMRPRAAAELLGVGENAVRAWAGLNDRTKRRRERERERLRMIEVARDAERIRVAKSAAKKRGGGVATAYSLAERMQDALGQAHAESQDRESREAFARAGEHYRKMRDEIVRALGVS